jgi:hypothetical protein
MKRLFPAAVSTCLLALWPIFQPAPGQHARALDRPPGDTIARAAGPQAAGTARLRAGDGKAAPRARVGVYYFDGWAGKHRQADSAAWARNAPTHLTERMLKDFADREPIWGWRDDTPAIMEQQIGWAADHAIDFFSFCWYWGKDPKAIREDPKHVGLELYLKAKNNARLRFCLMIANHQGFLFDGTGEWKKAWDVWLPYLKHKQYVTVGGRPLLIVFNPANGDKTGFEYLQQAAAKAGLRGLAIAACGEGSTAMGFTHRTRYNVVPGWFKGHEAHKYRELFEAHKATWKGSPRQPCIPALAAGWDSRPWEGPSGYKPCWYYPDRTPEQFASFVRQAIEWMEKNPTQTTAEKLMLIFAWNEYGEGGWLAPTKGDPTGKYLKALRAVVRP